MKTRLHIVCGGGGYTVYTLHIYIFAGGGNYYCMLIFIQCISLNYNIPIYK